MSTNKICYDGDVAEEYKIRTGNKVQLIIEWECIPSEREDSLFGNTIPGQD